MAKADLHKAREDDTIALSTFRIIPEDVEIIEVTLSQRNLLSLLAKLHIEGSKKTIYNGDVPQGYVLKLVAEDDETHYVSRGAPGGMTPQTEKLVAALEETLDTYERESKVVSLFHESVEKTRGKEA